MAFWIFQNVVITAALAGIVLLLCRVTRLGPVARHALWVLVLVKFVTPPLVVWPWAAPDPLGIARFDATNDEHVISDLPLVHLNAESPVSPVDVPETRVMSNAHQSAAETAPVWPWLLGVWIAGSLFVLSLDAVRLSRLGRRIRDARPVDPAIAARVETLSQQFGLKPIPVLAVDDLSSPVVWCVGRPRLLWPADLAADASDACVDGLLVHELAHIKRRDHFVGWVEFAAAIVWWWNPVFWYVRAARREQAELACDAWVISALPNGRRAYAESLLTLSIAGSNPRAASPAAVLGVRASTRRVLERRLVMIMKGRVPVRLSWMGLSIVALMAAATLPAWATGPQTKQAPPKVVEFTKPVLVDVQKAEVKPERKAERLILQTPVKPTDQKVMIAEPDWRRNYTLTIKRRPNLPAEGQDLIDGYDADRKALDEELDRKVAARRATLEKSLTDLQEKYAKAGKLDEAVAIRDFIKAGMPGLEQRLWINKK